MQRDTMRITGRVQGVFFRASTREQAQHLGLTGWVRNEIDGSVQCCVEGPVDALDALRAWIDAGGPSGARVDAVHAERGPASGEFDGFVVLR